MRLTSAERTRLEKHTGQLVALREILNSTSRPTSDTAPEDWHRYLAEMKDILGNTSNVLSFISMLLAREYLCCKLRMRPFDVAAKAMGAKGLDIDEQTVEGDRVIAEGKTTTPYNGNDLGSQQRESFGHDFAKLNRNDARHKFFFVTHARTFELMKRKYSKCIPGVTIVLLPSGEEYTAPSENYGAE